MEEAQEENHGVDSTIQLGGTQSNQSIQHLGQQGNNQQMNLINDWGMHTEARPQRRHSSYQPRSQLYGEYREKFDQYTDSSSSQTPTTDNSPVTIRKFPCGICLDNYEEPFLFTMVCPEMHVYCMGCLRKMIFNSMKTENMFPIRCCRVEVPETTINAVLTEVEFKQYKEVKREYATENRLYCSKPECSKFIPPSKVTTSQAICRFCKTITCTRCKETQHTGDCKIGVEIAVLKEIAKQKGSKQCPKCDRMIVLYTGCNHMTCICKTQFCYEYLKLWKTCECHLWMEGMGFDAFGAWAPGAWGADPCGADPWVAGAWAVPGRIEVPPPEPELERIERAQARILQVHDCQHQARFIRNERPRPPHGVRYERCNHLHVKYILVCPLSELMVCEPCRRLRL